MQKWLNKYKNHSLLNTLKILLKVTILFIFILTTLLNLTFSVNSQNKSDDNYLGRNFGCSIPETSLTIENLFRPTAFIPVIPDNCSTTPEGEVIPLSPALIPSIIARFFGFLASWIFLFLIAVVIISGIMWIWGGIDNKNISQAKQNFRDALISVLLMVSTYVIISTIISVLSPNREVVNNLTNISNFFNTRTR